MSSRLRLRTIAFVGGSILMLVPALIAGSTYTGALQKRAEQMLVDRLKGRGELSANLLAKSLHQLWGEVDALAKTLDPSALPEARTAINLVARLDNRYSWIGVADVEGTVLAAANGLLERESVAQRPWFRRGLSGPTAIDVHEAQLLAKLLPVRTEPYRFIDLSAPIQKAGQSPSGVVGAHLNWSWIIDSLQGFQAPGIDVLLLSRDRTVLIGPPELTDKPLMIGSAQAANRTTSSVLDERWPDGKDYVTVVVPAIGYADLPSFGWSLLIRQNIDAALAPTRELVRNFWMTLGGGALVALALLWLAANWLATPMTRLVSAAEGMLGDGEQKPPHPETRYAEAERLSTALVRLQTRLHRH
ncbi:cache domain-containing protein [Bosea sp. TAB14]|uniref:cache domain-containing protein n=1 Tax=Bosea sp. TAB14 TaxID=3237481 RepID=UPI003F91DFB9